MIKLQNMIAILIIVGIGMALIYTYLNCDGTLIRTMFWYECVKFQSGVAK